MKSLSRRQFLAAATSTIGASLLAACGAAPTATPAATATPQVIEKQVTTVVEKPVTQVVEKQGSSILLGTGPVLGAIGGVVAILGTALPWVLWR